MKRKTPYQLSTLIRALGRALRAFVTRRPLIVTSEVWTEREAECQKRDGECYDAVFDQCKICSCHVTIKTLFATEECPRRFWKHESVRTKIG